MIEIGIKPKSQCVKRVADARRRCGAPRYQRLCPEPEPQRERGEDYPAEKATPVEHASGVGHFERKVCLGTRSLCRHVHACFATSWASSRALRKSSLPVPR